LKIRLIDKKTLRTQLGMQVVLVVFAFVFLIPIYFVLVNSFKPYEEILTNTVSIPSSLYFENYTYAWTVMNYPKAFVNSLLITVFSNIGLIVISSMAAYKMVRSSSKWMKALFIMFISAMLIPFQTVMVTLVKVGSVIGIMNSYWGLIVCYFGFGLPLTVFLYHGFIKSIPREIEEAAAIDGCNVYAVFWKVVFPLLKPMTVTVLLLNTLWIWNDFLLPSLILRGKEMQTIPLAIYAFFGQYMKQWDLALAALVLGVIPIICFFLGLQKYIVEGITAGSVKG